MKYRLDLFALLTAPALMVLMLLGGCGKEKSPFELLADSTLVEARSTIDRGDYAESRSLLHKALLLDQRLKRFPQQAEEFRLLAENHVAGAGFDSALICYRRAQELYKGLADRRNAATMVGRMASVRSLLGDQMMSYTLLTESLRLEEAMGDSAGIRELRWAMVPACRALDFAEEERRVLNDLLQTHTATGDLDGQARVHFEFGSGYFYRNEWNQAVESFLRALTLADQSNDSLLAIRSLLRLAMTFDRMGRENDAFQTYTDGLRRADVTAGALALREEMLMRVGNVYLRNRQFDEARRFYEAALHSARLRENKFAEAFLLLSKGHCDLELYASPGEAMGSYEAAREFFRLTGFHRGSAYALFSIGVAKQRSGQLNDAAACFRAAVNQVDSSHWIPAPEDVYLESESAFFLAQRLDYFDAAIELLLQIGRSEEAFWYVECRQRRRLAEQLGALHLRTSDEATIRPLARFVQAMYRYGAIEKQLASALCEHAESSDLLAEIGRVMDETLSRMDILADSASQASPVLTGAVRIGSFEPKSLLKFVPPNSALMEFAPRRNSTTTFILTNTSATTALSSFDKAWIRSAAQEFTTLLRKRLSASDSLASNAGLLEKRILELSSSLYAAIVRPAAGAIHGVSRLIIVLPEEWGQLPLHALRPSGAPRGSTVGEQFVVSYLGCASALAWPAAAPAPTRQIVGLGHAGESLWDVEYELRDIRAFSKDARLFFKQEATLQTLRRESADLLHVAAEFCFTHRAPSTAYVLLSDGKADNSMAPVRWGELFALPAYPTVVLSNLSERLEEGYVLLPSIFLINGSAHVVLPAYPPTRKAKKYFGEQFYTALLAGSSVPMSYKRALQELAATPEFSSPAFWAPFFLWGK